MVGGGGAKICKRETGQENSNASTGSNSILNQSPADETAKITICTERNLNGNDNPN